MNVSDQVTEVGVKYLAEMATEIVPAGYKQTEVGVIPEDWDLTTIDNVAIFTGGAQPPRSTFLSRPKLGYVRLIQIRDYKTSDYETYIPESFARKKCSSTDIMIGRYGPPIFQILRGIDGAYNVALIKAIPKAVINQEFLYYFLKTEKLFELMELLSQRSSGQTGVELPALKAYLIPLPHKYEQTAIANALYDVDALINELEKLITKKQAIKTATMQQLLTGRTRLPQFALREDGTKKGYKQSELGEIPEDWGVCILEDICEVIDPHPSHRAPPEELNGIPFLGIGDLDEHGNIVKTNYRTVNSNIYLEHQRRYKLEVGLLGLGRVASIGKVVKLRSDIGIFTISPTLGIINPIDIDKDFLFYFLSTDLVSEQFQKIMSGSTRSSVGMVVLRKLIVLKPTREESLEIGFILSDMDTEIQTLQQRLSKTRQIKQGMMQELLTGKTRLKIVQSETA